MCILHKWGRWNKYESTSYGSWFGVPAKNYELRQSRECLKCGFSQDEFVSSKAFLVPNPKSENKTIEV
jgi:hypothetical protein